MPPHQTYIEPFLGGGAVLRHKKPAEKSIGIDLCLDAIYRASLLNIPNLTLHHGNALAWLRDGYPTVKNNCAGSILMYLDPPYIIETRRTARPIYKYELTEQDHRDLLASIVELDCLVLISGYYSEMYAQALSGWTVQSFQTMTRGGTMATEYLWYNFPTPEQLHDYQYLGQNYLERQRIKRKINRWTNKLASLPPTERHAILESLNQVP